jgi:hypothetical protein
MKKDLAKLVRTLIAFLLATPEDFQAVRTYTMQFVGHQSPGAVSTVRGIITDNFKNQIYKMRQEAGPEVVDAKAEAGKLPIAWREREGV